MSCQCPNCERLFSNQRSLKLHVPSCRRRHLPADNDTHHQLEHHPLRSFCYVNDTSSFNKDGDSEGDRNDYNNDDSDISDFILAESGVCSDDYNKVDQFLNDYEEAQGKQSTTASKLQIKLNHLINSHKAPLKLYDDIVDLFNEYMSSENFNKYARLKSRKSFIKANESIYNVTHLRPKYHNVVLTYGVEVTVPVFDAKLMIMDLITNPETMNETNIALGYDVFTGDVDETIPENQCYGEIHTGNQWLPARDRYCSNNNEMANEMPIALIIFGDKSHTNLHGSLSLTPIIFTLTLFN